MQKNILAINDISCFGKCSLTVALPIISACGHTTTVLPTALLSTHTGGFEGYTFHATTDEMIKIANHFKSLGIKFDAIYSGYLGDESQISHVSKIIDMFKTDSTLVLVDPVLGDHGKFYSNFDEKFACAMMSLVKKSDIITPNLTECAILANISYESIINGEIDINSVAFSLREKFKTGVVITGVTNKKGKMGVLTLKLNDLAPTICYTDREKGAKHGTGDIFASTFISLLLLNKSWEESAKISSQFLSEAIKHTPLDTPPRNGLAFEKAIPYLINNL